MLAMMVVVTVVVMLTHVSRQGPRSSTTDSLYVPADFQLLDVAPFLSLLHIYGTICFHTLHPHRLCLHLSND